MPAIMHGVWIVDPEGQRMLSNGDAVHGRVWGAFLILVMFPLIAVGTVGLTHLTESLGRFIEDRRKKPV